MKFYDRCRALMDGRRIFVVRRKGREERILANSKQHAASKRPGWNVGISPGYLTFWFLITGNK